MSGWWMKLVLLGLLFLSSKAVTAKDAGVVGPVYPIAEEDALDLFRREASKIDPEIIREKFLDDVRKQGSVDLGVPHTEFHSDRRIEPQAVLTEDIRDGDGKIIAKKGTVFNPIEKSLSNRTYLVVDGTDEKQVIWLKKKLSGLENRPVKILVTRGNVFELSQAWKKMVYPATKEIVNALYVKTVSTQVTQEGKVLHVEAEVQ